MSEELKAKIKMVVDNDSGYDVLETDEIDNDRDIEYLFSLIQEIHKEIINE